MNARRALVLLWLLAAPGLAAAGQSDPLARPLCIYIDRAPGMALAPLLQAWFVFGNEAQLIVASEGLVSLTAAQIDDQLQRIDLAHE